ncbi:MAG: threonylcarbamoyl-AMP synthase [Anaerolineales bacterium]|nr:threonylcarbamoyl-AMP synthase [Anaerolineales bacterium]
MKTLVYPIETPQALTAALQMLRNGKLVAFPTDTVYGLGALVFDTRAIERIYAVKNRPVEKAIPVLLGNMDDITKISSDVPDIAYRLASRFWPGPLTLIVPKHPELPDIVSAVEGVGIRIPDHPAARVLLNAAGPMAVTSANISGGPNTTTASQVLEQLQNHIPLILDGGETPGGAPSTVVDCLGKVPVVLRDGPISKKEIFAGFSPALE